MKELILFLAALISCFPSFPQVSPGSVATEATPGTTQYDLQTNKSCQNRLYRYSDGTMGMTFMYSQNTSWTDRGTGYNYYNGTSWGAQPSARIENIKTGWPSYAPYGTGGEIVVSHKGSTSSLVILKRTTKGSGTWTQADIPSPSGSPGMSWPRMVTNGATHNCVHLIALTTPVANGGVAYQGLDGALLYNRSLDGGTTWGGWQLLPGMTSALYKGFQADSYAWAEPKGDTLCFVVGDMWNDLFIMKSTNNGASWSKTIVWNCLYNLWAGTTAVPEYYCPDGSNAVALDNQGKAHVVFGRQRASGDDTGVKYWHPFTDGIIYWNENQAQLVQSLDSASLVSTGNFIGWVQDPSIWASSTTELAWYNMSLSSMPSITIDSYNHIYAVWSGVTNNRDASNYMLRHIFARSSVNDGVTWCPNIVELTGGINYYYLECAYPGLSPTSTDNIYMVYQCDDEAGNYVRYLANPTAYQGQGYANVNDIRVQSTLKSTISCGGIPQVDFSASNVNPAPNTTVIFTDLSANSPTSWSWSFAPSSMIYVDGTNSTTQNPHVQFSGVGYYSVTLTATNSYGSGNMTKTNYIHVAIAPPVANFIANQTNITAGQQVQFTDQSTGGPTTWSWSFPGGTPSSSNVQSPPLITYSTAGQYDVTLTVSNAAGSNTNTKVHYITVTVPAVPPVANFTANQTSITAGQQVIFTDQSTNSPTTWQWTFQGGSPSSSTLQSPPAITYSTAGQYDVTLTVTNAAGSSTNTKTHYITVTNPAQPPVAEFTANQTNIPSGGQVQFTDLSTGTPTTWSWSFPGGTPSSSTQQSPPQITYSTAGQYDVSLTVTNGAGSSTNTKSQYIVVSLPGAPVANFMAIPTSVAVGGQVQFYDLSSGNPTTWQWSFPGGYPSAYYQQNPPPVTYYSSGQYDVILTVVNGGGSSTNTKVKYIKVGNSGVPEPGSTGVLLYPNPAVDHVTIRSEAPVHEIVLLNGQGDVVLRESPCSTEAVIRLENVPNGLYFIQIRGIQGMTCRKLIVSK